MTTIKAFFLQIRELFKNFGKRQGDLVRRSNPVFILFLLEAGRYRPTI